MKSKVVITENALQEACRQFGDIEKFRRAVARHIQHTSGEPTDVTDVEIVIGDPSEVVDDMMLQEDVPPGHEVANELLFIQPTIHHNRYNN